MKVEKCVLKWYNCVKMDRKGVGNEEYGRWNCWVMRFFFDECCRGK